MAFSTLRRGSFDRGPGLAVLWTGVLAGPIVWAVLLETHYVLSYVACERRATWMLHLATGVALALIAAAAFAAWRAAPPLQNSASEPIAIGRARFLAWSGLILCAWFAIVVLATQLPILVLEPCTP
jgi:hypothetical protein